MDSFSFNNIKAEKANAMFRYRRLQKITAMFRLIELCIILILVSRFTTQLPVAFKLSGEYFKGLSVTAVSPRFVFVVGNVIVIVLFLKSGQLSAKHGESSNGKLDLYDEYVKNCEKNRNIYIQEIKKYRKQSTCVIQKDAISSYANHSPKEKKMHRSHSENLRRLHREEAARGRELRRTVTQVTQKSVDNGEKTAASSYAEDQMSSEEFRRTVEAFIARHQRNLREEEFSATVTFETSY